MIYEVFFERAGNGLRFRRTPLFCVSGEGQSVSPKAAGDACLDAEVLGHVRNHHWTGSCIFRKKLSDEVKGF